MPPESTSGDQPISRGDRTETAPPAASLANRGRSVGGTAPAGPLMPDRQPPPEIETLRSLAWQHDGGERRVWLDDAERAVLDAVERRTREIVEALRGLLAVDDPSAWGAMNGDEAVERAADFIERSFLSPDNPEGNA